MRRRGVRRVYAAILTKSTPFGYAIRMLTKSRPSWRGVSRTRRHDPSVQAEGVGSKWMTGALGVPAESVLQVVGADLQVRDAHVCGNTRTGGGQALLCYKACGACVHAHLVAPRHACVYTRSTIDVGLARHAVCMCMLQVVGAEL